MVSQRIMFAIQTLCLVICTTTVKADVKPVALFTDHMVIQQQVDAPIWGWADAGETVTVMASWGEQATTTADSTGAWSLTLKTPAARVGDAQSYRLTFEGENRIEVNDVLVGEVWLASGQSNMEYTIAGLELGDAEIGDSDLPMIREYTVRKNATYEAAADTRGHWMKASPETIGSFSGTAYFFARSLQEALNVPVGIINASWGGTRVEAWISTDAQKSHAVTQAYVAERDEWAREHDAEELQAQFVIDIVAWREAKANAERQNIEFTQKRPTPVYWRYQIQNYTGTLYNGMICPVKPYAVKGTIWYQGESNGVAAEDAAFYRRQLSDLITSWRDDWHDANMPFYIVQLANFRAPQVNPVEADQHWPIVRESMRKVADEMAHVNMAVAIDIGDAEDIHPRNKMELGRRLALQTLHNDYGHDLVPAGPLYRSFTIEGDSILVDFEHKGSGLVAWGDDHLRGFAIKGGNGDYVWADAIIVERSNGWKFWQKRQLVQVRSDRISEPKSVRYGWADNPDMINLYNKEGLPASPFSTD